MNKKTQTKNTGRMISKVSIFFLAILFCFGICGCSLGNRERKKFTNEKNSRLGTDRPIRIGYFHGRRTQLLFRAYINNYFKDEGLDVELYSKYFNKDGFYIVPKSWEGMAAMYSEDGENLYFGTVRGTEIVQAIDKGSFEGGCVGESSFVYKIKTGSPIVAVAMLGRDDQDEPAKAIVLRKDVVINKPEDFKGKVLMSRRAGPGDAIFLREFIKGMGLDPEKDLTILDQVPYQEQEKLIRKKAADGFLGHLCEFMRLVESGECYIYRKMDWMNQGIPHGLLVFRKDFLESHPKEVKKIIRAYMRRIKYEQGIPEEEKIKEDRSGLQMSFNFQGMSMPKYEYPPYVNLGLLKEVQELLLKYKVIDEKFDLGSFVNNNFVKEIYEERK